MNRFALVFLIVICSLQICCKDNTKRSSEVGDDAQKKAIKLKGMDHGLISEVVNIMPVEADSTKYQIIIKNTGADHREIEGNKAEISFKSEQGLVVNDQRYIFRHLHFHTPGPHRVQGMSYPMEFHVVTQPENRLGSAEYLVVSTLFKLGEENPFIDELLKQSTDLGHSKEETELAILKGGQAMVNKTNLDMDGFYHYTGPLATNPNKNTVEWYIARKIFEVSPQQLERISTYLAQEQD